MNLLHEIRRRLAVKLFLSYLVIVLVGAIVLAATAEAAVPRSFERHLAAMAGMMDDMMGMPSQPVDLNADLFTNFRAAVNESLLLAASAAILSGLIVSLFVSRRVVAPIRAMMAASSRIADGRYSERVRIPGLPAPDEMDELDQLAVRFNRMAEQLERTEAMRRQLIGDVAHELRTPLAAIKGSMEGLLDGVLAAEPQTIQQILREADRLQRLVDDLQELSRAEAGVLNLQPGAVAVSTLVEAARARLARQFDEKGVGLTIDLDPSLPMVHADEDRIGQALLNLVGNALQYTPNGGKVTVRARRAGEAVQISIIDTGIGIPPEHLPHIFTRFYRVDRSRSRAGGGSGIGLTIAKHIVEAHGGRIWAQSPGADQGSTFTFTLPAAGS